MFRLKMVVRGIVGIVDCEGSVTNRSMVVV